MPASVDKRCLWPGTRGARAPEAAFGQSPGLGRPPDPGHLPLPRVAAAGNGQTFIKARATIPLVGSFAGH